MPELNPDGTVALDPEPDDATACALAIVDCELCDENGYRGSSVCDHIDHVATTEHGRALVAAELEKIAARKSTVTKPVTKLADPTPSTKEGF